VRVHVSVFVDIADRTDGAEEGEATAQCSVCRQSTVQWCHLSIVSWCKGLLLSSLHGWTETSGAAWRPSSRLQNAQVCVLLGSCVLKT